MDSTIPQDLLDLKSRIDHWRSTRRFIREALPADLREAIAETVSRHPVRLIKKTLKLDPYRFRPVPDRPSAEAPPVNASQRIDFVALPFAPATTPDEPGHASLCHLRIHRHDGSKILITVPPSSADIIRNICSDFLSSASR